jgi:peptide/nickel transport system permease protein
MLRMIASRLWQGAVVLLAVTALTFTLLASAGGDALASLGHDTAISERAAADLRNVYGLDRPFLVRYSSWLWGIARGDLGYSFYFHAPVATMIWVRFWRTLASGTLALIIAWTVALTFGVLAARDTRLGVWVNLVCRPLATLAIATPRLVLAFAAVAIMSGTGIVTANSNAGATQGVGRLLLASVVLAVPLAAVFLTQTRESFRSAMNKDFVRVARAKGLSERVVMLRHAARAALNPLITLFGASLGGVLSGSVVVESVLGWGGLGELSVLAVRSRDVGLLLTIVLLTSIIVLLGNLLADIMLLLNDPVLRASVERCDTRPVKPNTTSDGAPL